MNTFATVKQFYNGRLKIELSQHPVLSEQKREELRERRLRRLESERARKADRIADLTRQLNDYTNLLRMDLRAQILAEIAELSDNERVRTIENMRRSVRRAQNKARDYIENNSFDFFVTVTFDEKLVDRYDDNETRKAFSKFVNNLKHQYPDMYYIAVPEYHKLNRRNRYRAALHFHMLIGGVPMSALKCRLWKLQTKGKNKGKPIFRVGAWKWGAQSTLTCIKNREACGNYVLKYLSKQLLDPRFLNKKRYYASANLKAPVESKFLLSEHALRYMVHQDFLKINYFSDFRNFGVLETSAENLAEKRAEMSLRSGAFETLRKSQLFDLKDPTFDIIINDETLDETTPQGRGLADDIRLFMHVMECESMAAHEALKDEPPPDPHLSDWADMKQKIITTELLCDADTLAWYHSTF